MKVHICNVCNDQMRGEGIGIAMEATRTPGGRSCRPCALDAADAHVCTRCYEFLGRQFAVDGPRADEGEAADPEAVRVLITAARFYAAADLALGSAELVDNPALPGLARACTRAEQTLRDAAKGMLREAYASQEAKEGAEDHG